MAGTITYPNAAHVDGNQQFTQMGVIGTQGTSDTQGTALPLPVAVNASTGAQYVWLAGTDVAIGGGASGSTVVTIGTVVGNVASGVADAGNPVKVGAIFNTTQPTVTDGQRVDQQSDNRGNQKIYLATKLDGTNDSITVTTGTIATGSLSNLATLGTIQNLNTGTLAVVTAGSIVHTGGTLNTGTINSGTITRVEGGSMVVTSGTIGVNSGSVVVTVGTIANVNQGTITKLEGGTLGVVAAGSVVVTGGTTTVNTGTIVVASGTLGSVTALATVGTVLNLGAGTITAITAGTIVQASGTLTTGSLTSVGTLGTIVAGTITSLQGGTLGIVANGSIVQTAGTVTTGSLSNVANLGTMAILTAGTLTALGAGTVTVGTINREGYRGINQTLSFGTLGTANGSFFGTLSPGTQSGAGTFYMISGLSVLSVTGTPNTYTRTSFNTNTNIGQLAIFYAQNVNSSGAFSVIGSASAVHGVSMVIAEYSGAASVPFDTAGSVTGNGTTINSGTTATLAQASEVAFAVATHDGGNISFTAVTTGGWVGEQSQPNGVAGQPINMADHIVVSTTALHETWNIGASQNWVGCIATFKTGVGTNLVQSAGTSNTAATTTSASWGANTTTGNLVVVGVTVSNVTTVGTVSAVADTQSNTYTRAIRGTISEGISVIDAEIWFGTNITGGAGSVTATHTSDNCSMFVREYKGFNTLDLTNSLTGSSAAPNSGTSANNAVANELVVIATGDDKGATQTYAAAGSYGDMVGTTATLTGISMEDMLTTAIGAQTGTLTFGAAANWVSLLSSFQNVSGSRISTLGLLSAG